MAVLCAVSEVSNEIDVESVLSKASMQLQEHVDVKSFYESVVVSVLEELASRITSDGDDDDDHEECLSDWEPLPASSGDLREVRLEEVCSREVFCQN